MRTTTTKINKMGTQELEAYLDSRYEAGAPQVELEALETAFAGRVSEDENTTEEEPAMSEAYDMGVDLEEWLAIEYYQFINPQERIGGRETKDYFSPECFNDYLSLNLKPNIKRKDIMTAAKDIYEYKINLIRRQKSKTKLSNIPTRLSNLSKKILTNPAQKRMIQNVTN